MVLAWSTKINESTANIRNVYYFDLYISSDFNLNMLQLSTANDAAVVSLVVDQSIEWLMNALTNHCEKQKQINDATFLSQKTHTKKLAPYYSFEKNNRHCYT